MEPLVVAYYPLVLVTIGTMLNLLTFLILCRSKFRNTREKPTFHYMRAVAIFDILMLYGWNLDHYMSDVHGFMIQTLSIPACRFFSFLNYFAAQTSAWLRVFISFDRYLAMSRLHRTWFGHSKHVLTIIISIILIFTLLNLQFFIVGCSYKANGSVSVYSKTFTTYPLWDYINLGVYNCAPFILMIIFNSGVIYHLFHLNATIAIKHIRFQHRAISITLLITTFLFLIMTVPSTVAFALFYTANETILDALDNLLYSYHTLSFPLYFITYGTFRREFIAMILCKNHRQPVLRQNQIQPN